MPSINPAKPASPRRARPPRAQARAEQVRLPADRAVAEVRLGDRSVRLTNLDKAFWPRERITKRDLLTYYLSVADVLLPHLRRRAMVMKRYPDGVEGAFFLHEARPGSAPGMGRDLPHRARVRQRDRFPRGPGSRVAALGRQPRLHRPEPLVCALRRHPAARLPALRPGPGHGRAPGALRARARSGPARARCAGRARDAELGQDLRVEGHARLCPHPPRTRAEAGLDVREGIRPAAF